MAARKAQAPTDRATDPSRVYMSFSAHPKGSAMESYALQLQDMSYDLPSSNFHSTKEMEKVTGEKSPTGLSPGFSFDKDEFKEKHGKNHTAVIHEASKARHADEVKSLETKAASLADKVYVKKFEN